MSQVDTSDSVPTTSDDWEVFREEVEKWMDIFGMKDWQVTLVWEELNDLGLAAQASCIANNRTARISLGKHKSPFDSMARLAFHETCHLLLADITELTVQKAVSEEERERAEHIVIRRLEKVFWVPYAEKSELL